MEGLQTFARALSKDLKTASSSSSSPATQIPYNLSGRGVSSAALSSSDTSGVLVALPPRQVVSLWTCSKLCAVFFVAGVFVGFTLKRRVRRWASKLLRRLKDD
ncbi:uncharacterized protein LOC110812050 [Carica papaya]|uniref:uncharacterized protein LOC110812050 n=1 Tax=Carica papaya TaxID=3649 RepID=UPI000B8C9933|nr:uncharacterized protein LOC110812050 [Carica papaya]XP_021894403.1 uncharacterized protein LOC110812050 [Carica papaya]XP_021894404.1 uncharacterized protein LOC110812050 [Carica papaya]XP_021894405.1 uncharacterized protein LOC110812050 [Carica papaya]